MSLCCAVRSTALRLGKATSFVSQRMNLTNKASVKTPNFIGCRRFSSAVEFHHVSITSTAGNQKGWNTTSVRRIHREGDKELADFLKGQIAAEKESDAALEYFKIQGFEFTKLDGSVVVLTRKSGNETITVKFNVNNTIEECIMSMDENIGDIHDNNQKLIQDKYNSKIVSRPIFLVEVNKSNDTTLAIQCACNAMPVASEEGQDMQEFKEKVEIECVTLLNKSQELTDDVYSIYGNYMDQNLYYNLLNLLNERGINSDFLDKLVDLSTVYEHRRYVGLLEQLKEFAQTN